MKEWLYGRNPVYEALRANRRQFFSLRLAQGAQEKGRLAEIVEMAAIHKLPVERLARQRLEAISTSSQGVALECSHYPYVDRSDLLALAHSLQEEPFLLILDTLQDPQNLGTLLRTAEAVGVHGILLPLKHTVTITPAVVNASAGASEYLLAAQANLAQAIASLKEAGVWVIGLDSSSDAQAPDKVRLDGPLALVVGSEGQGMRPLVRNSCDALIRLPMRGKVESLNAAVAGSIALYLARQARG
jgi:23S rRNA (guanosine2251-2'-O)-methyltransferase